MSECQWEERHVPVLVDAVAKLVELAPRRVILDGTVGLGGHGLALLERFDDIERYVGCDVDPRALAVAKRRLAKYEQQVDLHHCSYVDVAEVLADDSPGLALLDLGVSTLQLTDKSRGFSFRSDGPLDMRMNPFGGSPVSDWLLRATAKEIQDSLSRWGEVRGARTIARAIYERRGKLQRTSDLVGLLEEILPARIVRDPKRSPVNQIFQALRIQVNQELNVVQNGLEVIFDLLPVGALFLVISFHSLEDRIVKRFFQKKRGRCTCPPGLPICGCGSRCEVEILTKKPIRPSDEEIEQNPASRPSKLRAVMKVQPC